MVEETQTIYLGSRDNDFKTFIQCLLKKGQLKPKYIDILTDSKSMLEYGAAFTAVTADSINNYERYEQLGDLSANKFIVSYAYNRFPQIDCTQGVKIAARLRILYGSKNSFAPIADKLGFWPYISCQEDGPKEKGTEKRKKYRNNDKKALLEDTLESFIGCTENLLDKRYRPGVGYGIVYTILSSIFDDIPMSLRYEDLFDAKTRLKETFDKYKNLGNWFYIYRREKVGDQGFTQSIAYVYRIPLETRDKKPIEKIEESTGIALSYPRNSWILIGEGKASSQDDAEQKAASIAIDRLKNEGVYKNPPEIYTYFCE